MRGRPTPGIQALVRQMNRRGFTLIELMITLTVLAVVLVVLTTVMYTAARSKTATANRIESSQAGRVAMDMMARDLRSAGYGVDADYVAAPQPPIAYVDSMQLLICANLQPYPDSSAKHQAPLAYNPAGNPKPFPLVGTSWQPPIRYRSGAEIIRWTLDLNNDGAVNASDINDPNGVDAKRTGNPNDYELVRQVYGDSTNNVAGNNGGTTERIALVRKPGGTVPPMFTVYMKGSSTPWNWASGAVPANQLANIERVTIRVVAPSGRPDWRGQYAETSFKTDVYSMRNVPLFSTSEYNVDGYVFNDVNKNGVQDVGEPGLSGAKVSLGFFNATTNASGYYLFGAQAGTYVLKHTPPQGYMTLTNPDSFTVSVGPATSRSFADTVISGGWITVKVFEDLDGDKVHDSNEPWREGEDLTVTPSNDNQQTDDTGTALLFSKVGAFTLTLAVPDSFSCETSNPVTGTMTQGGSLSYTFALDRQSSGKIAGTVYQDKNGNGIKEGGENGVQNCWVGVTTDNGATVLSYDYTDDKGAYSIDVPANDPPKTNPYTVEVIPITGFYPTTPTEISNVYVQAGKTVSSQNFGINSFREIVLNANRVLSLASGDLIEKDWGGTKTSDARQDADLILGADASGTDQISAWFNQYNNNNLFNVNRSYARTAPNSVLALAADSLSEDPAPFSGRVDIVTGTKLAGAGNLFVWFTQATSGNEGYLTNSYSSAYKTQDNGDVQALQTANLLGNSGIDIVAGTKSPTAGKGTLEVWQSDGAATPTFTRAEIYPPTGGIPSNNLGEVTSMRLTDLNKKGKADLVIGTKTGTYSGQLVVLKGTGSISTFTYETSQTLSTGAVTALTCADYNLDNKVDVVLGVQKAWNKGELQFWKNTSGSGVGAPITFALDTTLTAPGVPLALASGDFGGMTNPDIAMGYRNDDTSYLGGILIYYMDNGTPGATVDPSGGTVVNMVPTVITNDFNYGVKPNPPTPPYLLDIAAGVKSSTTTGSLVVFIR